MRKKTDGERPLVPLQRLLLQRLDGLGAHYGISNDFTELSGLGAACAQAEYTLDHALRRPARDGAVRPVRYTDVMLTHMVDHFFDSFCFDIYCPPAFRSILKDSRSGSAVDNVRLLYTYLACQCNATSAARLLHMHRNNVIYRIARLQERYALDLDDCIQRTLLLMCCIAANDRNRQ